MTKIISVSFIILSFAFINVCALQKNATFSGRASNDNTGSVDRQYGDGALYPGAMMGWVFIPIAIIIGIGIILLKLLVIGLFAFGRGGSGFGGGGYPGSFGGGYGVPYTAASNAYGTAQAWQREHPSGRSLHDKDGQPIPAFVGSTIMHLIEKVSKALEKYDSKSKG